MIYKPLRADIRQERAEKLMDILIESGYSFASGVPDAVLKYIIDEFDNREEILHVQAVREGEAIGICAGASLGGRRAIAYMQNSGFFNSLHDISSLLITYDIPILFIISWRGCPHSKYETAVHHFIDGINMLKVLKMLGIDYRIVDIEDSVADVLTDMDFYLRIRHKILPIKKLKDFFEEDELKALLILRGVF